MLISLDVYECLLLHNTGNVYCCTTPEMSIAAQHRKCLLLHNTGNVYCCTTPEMSIAAQHRKCLLLHNTGNVYCCTTPEMSIAAQHRKCLLLHNTGNVYCCTTPEMSIAAQHRKCLLLHNTGNVYCCTTPEMHKMASCLQRAYLVSIRKRIFYEEVDGLKCLWIPDLDCNLTMNEHASIIVQILLQATSSGTCLHIPDKYSNQHISIRFFVHFFKNCSSHPFRCNHDVTSH